MYKPLLENNQTGWKANTEIYWFKYIVASSGEVVQSQRGFLKVFT